MLVIVQHVAHFVDQFLALLNLSMLLTQLKVVGCHRLLDLLSVIIFLLLLVGSFRFILAPILSNDLFSLEYAASIHVSKHWILCQSRDL